MKALKVILVILGALLLLSLIAAFIVPTKTVVERYTTIERPKAMVYDYIKLLKNQPNYSKWATMDPNQKTEYIGTDGTVGFKSKWEGDPNSVGTGEQEIMAIDPGNKIDYELRFIAPFESEAKCFLQTEADGSDKTKVTWGFSSVAPRPMNVMMKLMNMESSLAADFDYGLDKLKEIMESTPIAEPEPIGEATEM